MKKIILLVVTLLLISSPLYAKTISGKVSKVSDGDTITVVDKNKKEYKVRLYGIDCPEKKQSFGAEAKRFVEEAVLKKSVKVKIYDVDQYGRNVGVVLINDNNLNELLLENGLAWQYKQYCKESFCDDWNELERNARATQKGLWIQSDPTPPWEYRKTGKQKTILELLIEVIELFIELLTKLEKLFA